MLCLLIFRRLLRKRRWRTQQDSNLRPLPSEGIFSG